MPSENRLHQPHRWRSGLQVFRLPDGLRKGRNRYFSVLHAFASLPASPVPSALSLAHACCATGVCVDINECLKNNGGCDPRAECTNKEPGFECGPVVEGPCDAGFARATMNSPCRDVNECLTNNGGCHRTTDCINTEGSFYCTPCPNGTLGTGLTAEGCVDINECADYSTNNGDCDVRVVCTNVVCTAPGVDCRKQRGRTCGDCPAGFTGNGYDGCNDINECSLQPNGGCPADKPCFNEIGGSPGFRCGDCPDNTRWVWLRIEFHTDLPHTLRYG